MLVKLTEHYQDARHVFAPGQEVDIDEELGAWLVEHKKAVQVEAPAIELSMEFDDDPIATAETVPFEDPHPVDEPEETPKPARKRGKK